ncbi:MAG: SdiA-regulated domain-containing protein [Bacteroidales bacterium]|nr:SdiA-regulated domain-containing protein [Bacteroidales bacterium]
MKKNLFLMLIIFIYGSCILFISCSNVQNNEKEYIEEEQGSISFDLKKPVKTIKLPAELVEISALSYYKNNLLAAVQDENGFIYLINYKTGKIIEKIKIENFGDFEGIEIIDSTAYMMKSDGTIYRVENFIDENRKIEKFNPGFNAKNDCEGLAYDAQNHELLIACKAKAALAGNIQKNEHLPDLKKYRAIYPLRTDNMQVNVKPKFLLEKNEYEKISKTGDFKPSAIAIHPKTGNVYIIASAGKLLVILDKNGNYLGHAQLKPEIFRQPEGICFSPDGKKIFIANEGKGKKGTILIFESK